MNALAGEPKSTEGFFMVALQVALVALSMSGVGETVLMDFHADWCGPCRQMEGTVNKLAALGYPVRKVNIDQNRQLAAKYRVESIPCFVLVVDGKEVRRLVGATGLGDLEQLCQSAGVQPAGTQKLAPRAQSPDRRHGAIRFPSRASGPFVPAVLSGPSDGFEDAADGQGQEQPDAEARQFAQPEPDGMQGVDLQPEAVTDINTRLLGATVRVKIDDGGSQSMGSGTIIDSRLGEALVLTCGHIFRDSRGKGPIVVDLFGHNAQQGISARLISYDLTSDVGLVSFRTPAAVEVARVAPPNYVVHEDDVVINVGCSHGEEPTIRSSRVAAIDKFLGPPNFVVTGQPVQGRSGGGLFTEEGLLIGVCNAADPADDEGLYAALTSVHAELDRMGVADLCLEASTEAAGEMAGTADLPAMPKQMPVASDGRTPALVPTSADSGVLPAAENGSLDSDALEAVAQAQSGHDEAEVICIVRPLAGRTGKSEIVVLDRASPAFLERLSFERRSQQARRSRTRQEFGISAALNSGEFSY